MYQILRYLKNKRGIFWDTLHVQYVTGYDNDDDDDDSVDDDRTTTPSYTPVSVSFQLLFIHPIFYGYHLEWVLTYRASRKTLVTAGLLEQYFTSFL